MKCNVCNKGGLKSKRGVKQHQRLEHNGINPSSEIGGAPEPPHENKTFVFDHSKVPAPTPCQVITSAPCHNNCANREQLNDLKTFFTNLINSMGDCVRKQIQNNEQNMNTMINDLFDKKENLQPPFKSNSPTAQNIETPVLHPKRTLISNNINSAKSQLQPPHFSTISPTPTSTDTPFIPIESGPSKTLQRPNCGVQLINRFSALSIPTEQSAVQEQQDQRQQTWQPELTDLPPRNRTSRPFINQRPENDILKIAPGHAKYSEVVKQGSNHRDANDQPNSQSHQQRHQNTYKQKYKLCLLGDSNLHGITIRDFARELNHTAFIDKFAHSGATTVHLRTYAEVALLSKPEGIIIHGGTNDILGRNATSYSEDQIASTLIEIGVKARNENVKDIFISSVLPTKNKLANEKALQINNFLKSYCVAYNFVYIDNSNIIQDDLKEEERDLVHLSPTGREALMKNFSHYFNY